MLLRSFCERVSALRHVRLLKFKTVSADYEIYIDGSAGIGAFLNALKSSASIDSDSRM